MKIVKTVERELTENELLTVERFRSYTDGVSFALIGDNVPLCLMRWRATTWNYSRVKPKSLCPSFCTCTRILT